MIHQTECQMSTIMPEDSVIYTYMQFVFGSYIDFPKPWGIKMFSTYHIKRDRCLIHAETLNFLNFYYNKPSYWSLMLKQNIEAQSIFFAKIN